MSHHAEITSALLGQVTKLVKPLSDTEMKRIATNETKVALLAPGQQVVNKSPALTAALKVLERLSADELQQIEQRLARLTLLTSGQQIVEKSVALTTALKVLGQMSTDELRQIEDRSAKIVLLPKGAKIDHPLDPADVASQIMQLPNEPAIVAFLDSDSRLGAPNLKKVASVLSIQIPSSTKTKSDIQLYIAQSVVSERGRNAVR